MRQIDVAPFSTAPARDKAECGPAPDLRWIEIEQLVIDPAYQREITRQGADNVRRIAKAFDWRFFSAVVVSPVEGGRFAIIDGQHRTTAAALCGFKQVPCQIVHAAPNEQAAAFNAINGTTTKVSSLSRFRAAVAAGEPAAVRAKRLTDAAGIRILPYPIAANSAAAQAGDTMAVNVILRLCERYDDAFLATMFRAVRAAAGDMPGQISMLVLRSFADVLGDHPEWCQREAELIDACTELLPQDLYNAALHERAKRPNCDMTSLFQAELVTRLERAMRRKAA